MKRYFSYLPAGQVTLKSLHKNQLVPTRDLNLYYNRYI